MSENPDIRRPVVLEVLDRLPDAIRVAATQTPGVPDQLVDQVERCVERLRDSAPVRSS
jgi:hypothetical protein